MHMNVVHIGAVLLFYYSSFCDLVYIWNYIKDDLSLQ